MNEKIDISINLENLSKAERDQLISLIAKANKPKSKVWKPASPQETFYLIESEGYVIETTSYYSQEGVDGCDSIGNCFRTKEEAEFAIEYLKVVRELREFAGSSSAPYFLAINFKSKKVTFFADYENYTGNLRFETKEDAEAAIEAVGEDRLIKYYFRKFD